MYSPLKYLGDQELTAIVRKCGTAWIGDIAKAIEDAILANIDKDGFVIVPKQNREQSHEAS